MPPNVRVSDQTRACINPLEMDAQLNRLRGRLDPEARQGHQHRVVDPLRGQRRPLRIQSMNIMQENFIYGRGSSLDDFLSIDLRPVPPQPNCPQSMKIYDEHRRLAEEFVRVKREQAELRRYKQELTDKLNQSELETLTPEKAREYTQLKSEKDALLNFREKLAQQLKLIEAAQQNRNTDSAHSTGSGPEDWIIVKRDENT